MELSRTADERCVSSAEQIMTFNHLRAASIVGILVVCACFGGCGTISGFASDLNDASLGVRSAFIGDDPDSPAND